MEAYSCSSSKIIQSISGLLAENDNGYICLIIGAYIPLAYLLRPGQNCRVTESQSWPTLIHLGLLSWKLEGNIDVQLYSSKSDLNYTPIAP